MKKILFSLCFVVSVLLANAQQNEVFVGDWKYQGPMQPLINDTILLNKKFTASEYTKWKFSSSQVFDITYCRHELGLSEEFIQDKQVDDKWFFNESMNHLEIQTNQSEFVYKVITFESSIIKLVRIK